MKTKYMFDTNIFNRILDRSLDLELEDLYYVTHIQKDELMAESNEERRELLLKTFNLIQSVSIPTESAIWGVSKWDQCKWGDEDNATTIPTESFALGISKFEMAKLSDGDLYSKILYSLNSRKKRSNNVQDALIAETAIKNEITLVTCDKALKDVVKIYSQNVIDLEELLSIFEKRRKL